MTLAAAVSNGARFTLFAFMFAVIFGLAFWSYATYAARKDRQAEAEWRHQFEPNLPNVEEYNPYSDEDILHQRPLLPEEYPRSPDDYRQWKDWADDAVGDDGEPPTVIDLDNATVVGFDEGVWYPSTRPSLCDWRAWVRLLKELMGRR